MWLHECKHFTISHHLKIFDDHWSDTSGDITSLIFSRNLIRPRNWRIMWLYKDWSRAMIWKLIFIYQGYFYRKIPAINASFAPKSVLHLHGWSLKFGQNCKDVGNKILKCDVNKAQVNKKKICVWTVQTKLVKEWWCR